MEFGAAFIVAAVISLVAVRHFAARRVKPGNGRYVWPLFAPMFLVFGVFVWETLTSVGLGPLPVSGLLLGLAIIVMLVMIRHVARMSRAVDAASSQAEVEGAIAAELAELIPWWAGLLLVGSIVALVSILVWGLAFRS
jgi:hypothetical protein